MSYKLFIKYSYASFECYGYFNMDCNVQSLTKKVHKCVHMQKILLSFSLGFINVSIHSITHDAPQVTRMYV